MEQLGSGFSNLRQCLDSEIEPPSLVPGNDQCPPPPVYQTPRYVPRIRDSVWSDMWSLLSGRCVYLVAAGVDGCVFRWWW